MSSKKTHVIFDSKGGIYWGQIVEILENGDAVKLENARHCFYFPVPNHADKGVYSLATIGPQPGAKIGPMVNMIVRSVSKIVDCSSIAAEVWKNAKWEN